MKATDLPFDEQMKKFEAVIVRAGIDEKTSCLCVQIGAPRRHMCNTRYALVQNQIDYEIANFPAYPNRAA